jgi:hypothetical protein
LPRRLTAELWATRIKERRFFAVHFSGLMKGKKLIGFKCMEKDDVAEAGQI